jgi:hypothetical protein
VGFPGREHVPDEDDLIQILHHCFCSFFKIQYDGKFFLPQIHLSMMIFIDGYNMIWDDATQAVWGKAVSYLMDLSSRVTGCTGSGCRG